jgi:aconitate decarboxylase
MAVSNSHSRFGAATSERLVDLVMAHDFAALPAAVVAAAKTFLADTLAVGVAGSGQPGAARIASALTPGGDCGVLGRPGLRLAPYDAAMLNGFQIHCLEWDGLHEHSVVIALCVTTAALASEVQARSPRDPVSGQQLLAAFASGVETAVFFGSAANTGPRFFRPSTAA